MERCCSIARQRSVAALTVLSAFLGSIVSLRSQCVLRRGDPRCTWLHHRHRSAFGMSATRLHHRRREEPAWDTDHQRPRRVPNPVSEARWVSIRMRLNSRMPPGVDHFTSSLAEGCTCWFRNELQRYLAISARSALRIKLRGGHCFTACTVEADAFHLAPGPVSTHGCGESTQAPDRGELAIPRSSRPGRRREGPPSR